MVDTTDFFRTKNHITKAIIALARRKEKTSWPEYFILRFLFDPFFDLMSFKILSFLNILFSIDDVSFGSRSRSCKAFSSNIFSALFTVIDADFLSPSSESDSSRITNGLSLQSFIPSLFKYSDASPPLNI